jgi:uncharacterized protein YndB with AHSA1/START domain
VPTGKVNGLLTTLDRQWQGGIAIHHRHLRVAVGRKGQRSSHSLDSFSRVGGDWFGVASVSVGAGGAILEPRAGGRWYEQGVDGSECDWGQVLAWEPPHRLVVTWQINGQWQYDPDPEHASEIEVRFSADGPTQTTIELEHRHLDRLVDGQALRDGITGGGGWPSLLEAFAKAATNQT